MKEVWILLEGADYEGWWGVKKVYDNKEDAVEAISLIYTGCVEEHKEAQRNSREYPKKPTFSKDPDSGEILVESGSIERWTLVSSPVEGS